MFDRFLTDCPKCGHELEFQSKTGVCLLVTYGKKEKDGKRGLSFENPSADMAYGLMDQVIRCQFCNSRIKLDIDMPLNVKCTPKIVKQKEFDYDGNYNKKHPDSIKRMKLLMEHLRKTK